MVTYMGQAKGRAENEAEGNMSVAQLLAEQKSLPASKKGKEEKKEDTRKKLKKWNRKPKQESPEEKIYRGSK